ncbi:cell filamentation protein [Actinoplanes campanulatus]|uniref:protein adenylyltransferase n=1 Tax=Actinoplanes campanulatus TaxID=113559 RepID=A0A7W5APJ2_9ACTN|nr:putative adenosine monophosphate-protein transferase Fic [Actinoplanes campanulatus]MBB3100003.1 cell filamentation protein [Actinoplanes campanulatus]GGN29483.1 cell filamentation protein Fic [Actinoplanes campanulatus]GID38870.1 cell filamentation protein Fic [Actinoplanes campanulatus]
MTDPYLSPGTDCLKNKLGLTDPERLREAEFRIVSIRDVQISRTSIPGGYGLAHLQSFHRFLFQDLYEWAGRTRTVDISKPGARFCHWRYVDDQVGAVLSELEEEEYLIGLRREIFVSRLAHYYGELNVLHPFREGNGRTLRAFLRQAAAAAGYQLDWSELSRAENIEACRVHLNTADTAMLVEILDPVVSRLG